MFPQCPALIRVKWFLLILPRTLFTPTALRNCLRIFDLSVFSLFVYIFLYQYTIWNFLIYHLGVRIPVPDKWVFVRSSLYTILQNITMRNYFSDLRCFVLLYTVFIIPLCSCKFLRYYVSNLISWKIFENDFNSMVNIPLSYIFILSTNNIFLTMYSNLRFRKLI